MRTDITLDLRSFTTQGFGGNFQAFLENKPYRLKTNKNELYELAPNLNCLEPKAKAEFEHHKFFWTMSCILPCAMTMFIDILFSIL